ncbi:hypothetical protein Ga0466249_001096 [Sporomusaceae bacterium BoRhaA]|uniref:hypothetical protein n=1 Tax=Pelorhabdus rhamnosifermentans TaxID=2772457 RepID=UPI001C05FFDA|nr:hypothetical protein [Pelorhabdus rhamnosifermentans]MBU2700004.1 hypothetical protein [Pelorhabdus rhamnosifermentans]
MKKILLATLTASIIISGAGTTFAAEDSNQEMKLDGSLSIHYRDQLDKSNGADTTKTGWKTTLTLNIDAPLAKNLDAYASLNYQNINSNAGAGWINDHEPSGADKNYAALSAYGLKYNNNGYSYVVGSQDITLGGGLAYDNGYIGKNNLPYALNVSKKVGATDLNVIVAKTNYQAGIENDKFYAVQGSYAITPETNLGAMFAHVSYGKKTLSTYHLPDSHVNFYSVYGSHKLSDQVTLSAEYLKSSTKTDNQAYQTNLSYKLDGKNTLSVGYYHAEDQSDIVDYNEADMTTTCNTNTQGYTVSWKHNFEKNISLKIGYLNYTKINATSNIAGGTDRNRFYSTATISF